MNKKNSLLLSLINRHKTLIQNFSYLSALQVFNLLLPLITYPYLIRILGKDTYGLIVYAQAIISYLVILVNFGFNISATKEISIHRNNKTKLSEIVSSVYILKSALFIISLLLLTVMVQFIPQASNNKLLFYLCMWLCLYDLVFPIWYFQGIEKMKYITVLNLVSRLLFLSLIFIFVKQESHFLRVPLINGIGSMVAGIAAFIIIIRSHRVKIKWIPFHKLGFYLKESFVLFGSNAILVLKDKTNILLIGNFLGTGAVAEFDLAVKIKDLLFIPNTLINQTIYPKISRERNMKFLIKVMKISTLVMTGITIIIFPLIKPIVLLLGGEELINSIRITQIMLVSVPITVVSITLATNCINALGYYNLRFKGMVLTTIVYAIMIIGGVILGFETNLTFYAYVILLSYLVELLIRIYYVSKYKMLK